MFTSTRGVGDSGTQAALRHRAWAAVHLQRLQLSDSAVHTIQSSHCWLWSYSRTIFDSFFPSPAPPSFFLLFLLLVAYHCMKFIHIMNKINIFLAFWAVIDARLFCALQIIRCKRASEFPVVAIFDHCLMVRALEGNCPAKGKSMGKRNEGKR